VTTAPRIPATQRNVDRRTCPGEVASDARFSSRRTSVADCHRLSGSLARQRWTTSSIAAGTAGCRDDTRGGSCSRIARSPTERNDETAEVLHASPQTVMRDWRLARAWLAREVRGGAA
jgi:hypothetical protein